MKKIKILLGDGLFWSIFTVAVNTVSTGLSAVALIIISRVLGPANYGEFAVGFSISLVLVRINDFGLSIALVKAAANKSDKIQNEVFSSVLFSKLKISAALVVIGILFSTFVTNHLGLSTVWIVLLAFTFGLSTVYFEQLQIVLQSTHLFYQSAVVTFIQSLIKCMAIAALYFLGRENVVEYFLLYLIAPLVPTIFFKFFTPEWFSLLSKSSAHIEQKIKNIAVHSSVSVLSAGLIENIDILLVKNSLSSFETGLFAGVSRIAMLFSMMAFSLASVLNPRVAKYFKRVDRRKFIRKSFALVVLCLVAYMAVIPFSNFFIQVTLGEEYLSGVQYLQILLASAFLTIASIPFISLFYQYKSDWFFSISGILQLVILVGGNVIFLDDFGLNAAIYARLFSKLALFLFAVTCVFMQERKSDEK